MWNARESPRRTSCMRSSSASSSSSAAWTSDVRRERGMGEGRLRPPPAIGSVSAVEQALRLVRGGAQRALGEVEVVLRGGLALLLLVAHAQDDEARARGGAHDAGGDRAHPVARVVHGAELPRLELVGGHPGPAGERAPG